MLTGLYKVPLLAFVFVYGGFLLFSVATITHIINPEGG